MLNLDSEDEGVFHRRLCGRKPHGMCYSVAREKFDGTVLKVTVNGLRGGVIRVR